MVAILASMRHNAYVKLTLLTTTNSENEKFDATKLAPAVPSAPRVVGLVEATVHGIAEMGKLMKRHRQHQ